MCQEEREKEDLSALKTVWTHRYNDSKKRKLKRESESLLITAQNSTIRTNHIKARIDKTQQNRRCRLWGKRDETINHVISEWSKLSQKEYKTCHWEFSELKLDHTNKWYMHNQESDPKYDMHKLFWDFEIQTDHQITARRPDIIILTKKRELWELWTLLSRQTIECNWKNVKRRISTSTFRGNWKDCGTWKWWLYQL